AAARARGPVGAGIRLLQQQRLLGGPRQPARTRLAGGDERLPAASASRREPDRGERRRMNVLSLIHGDDVRAELFPPVAAEAGHPLDEWSFSRSSAPPRALDTYDAVFVFGGAMHPDEDEAHGWLPEEVDWLRTLLGRPVPTLGICLGSQLLARAADTWIAPAAQPEVGWYEVGLTAEGKADPVLSVLPPTFEALQWHRYEHGLPEGAVALADNAA